MPSILCCNARAPAAQLVRASDWNSQDPGSNPGWISMPFITIIQFLQVKYTFNVQFVFTVIQEASENGVAKKKGSGAFMWVDMMWAREGRAKIHVHVCTCYQERIQTGGYRVRVCNYVKFETRQNLLWVLKIVTHTVQLCVDISHCC